MVNVGAPTSTGAPADVVGDTVPDEPINVAALDAAGRTALGENLRVAIQEVLRKVSRFDAAPAQPWPAGTQAHEVTVQVALPAVLTRGTLVEYQVAVTRELLDAERNVLLAPRMWRVHGLTATPYSACDDDGVVTHGFVFRETLYTGAAAGAGQ